MTNIFHSENVEKDFRDFESVLNSITGAKYDISEPKNKSIIKKYHQVTYIIALLLKKNELQWKESVHKYIFLNEILSDLLINSHLSILGYLSSSLMIVRRILENFYNHIYYFDHPIELEQLNNGRNEYVPIIDLKKYIESYPYIKSLDDENIKIYNDRIFSYYHELCKVVHTKGVDFMGLARTLEEIKKPYDFEKHLQAINDIMLNIIYLLYKFHKEIRFTHEETNLITKVFSKDIRGQLLSL